MAEPSVIVKSTFLTIYLDVRVLPAMFKKYDVESASAPMDVSMNSKSLY